MGTAANVWAEGVNGRKHKMGGHPHKGGAHKGGHPGGHNKKSSASGYSNGEAENQNNLNADGFSNGTGAFPTIKFNANGFAADGAGAGSFNSQELNADGFSNILGLDKLFPNRAACKAQGLKPGSADFKACVKGARAAGKSGGAQGGATTTADDAPTSADDVTDNSTSATPMLPTPDGKPIPVQDDLVSVAKDAGTDLLNKVSGGGATAKGGKGGSDNGMSKTPKSKGPNMMVIGLVVVAIVGVGFLIMKHGKMA